MHSHRTPGSPALDTLLAGYAAGSLPRALHALVGSHLELQSGNRGFVRSLENALSAELDLDPVHAMKNRDERLSAIFGQTAVAPITLEASLNDPRSLVHYLGRPIDEIECKTVLPGVQEHRFEIESGTRAVLYRIRGGKAMPQHTHSGAEVTLVIRGAFSDATGRFGPGDVAITDEDVDHVPVAEAGDECVCFAVLDAPVKLTGPVGRWFNRFVKH